MGSYCFGIDVGGTTVKCGLFQTDGTLVDKWEIPTRTENKGENILPDVANAINLKLEEKKIDKADVEGVGIGIPGPINSKGEAACAVNLYWGFTPVAQILHDLTGLKAKAGNDANVAALGEAWKGAAAGAQNVILVTLGTGVGGGIIIDGKIVAGAHGAGGQKGARGRDGAVHPEPCFQRVRCGLSARRDRAAAERGRRAAHSGRLAVGRRSRARCLALSLPRGGVHARSQGAVRPDGDGTAARAR